MTQGNKFRIIHLQVLPILSGVQKSMFDVLVRLDRARFDITVLCNSEGELTEALRKNGIRCIILSDLRREINPYYDIRAFIKLFGLFKTHGFDLVHTHSSKPGIIGRLAANAAKVQCIVHTVHGFAFYEHSSKIRALIVGVLEKVAAMVTDKIIFVNDKDRLAASEMHLIPEHKMVTIYNGIDLEACDSRDGKNGGFGIPGVNKGDPVVAMVARLWKQKAPQYFISAIPFVLKKQPTTKFLVVGDGPMRTELENKSEALGIRDNVLFLGWRSDVRNLLKMVDVFVLPSLWEGLPISILEAMAASKPVVATNIKGNNELVIHGETGFLVETKNAKEIGRYVLKLLQDQCLAEKMGRMGKFRVREKFELSGTVTKLNALYETLLSDTIRKGTDIEYAKLDLN